MAKSRDSNSGDGSSSEPSDLDYLQAWRDGDSRAGEKLVARHYDAIYRFFRSKLSDDVTELVQDTFLTCTEKRDSFEGRNNAQFKTWLFGIGRMKLYEHFRRKKKGDRSAELDQESCVALGGSPSTLLRGKLDVDLLKRALPRIPLQSQLLLELYWWERFTAGQLARVMDVPESTIRARLRKAKTELIAMVEKIGDGAVVEQTLRSLSDWVAEMRLHVDEQFPDALGGDDEDEGDEGDGSDEDDGSEEGGDR